MDFSALWTNISAGETTIKSLFWFDLVPRGFSVLKTLEDPRDEFANFQTNGLYKSKDT